jgi:Holliday junction resolvasome RuvABC DNA-binding subunit
MECAPADDEAEASEPWKCINCLDCDQDFPASCEVHGDQHVAFKCFFCCNIATFFCGGKTHFCEQCHKHGWNATPMPKGECRPGCDGRHPDHGTKKIHCLGCVVCRSLGLNFSTKSAQSKQRLAYIKVKKGLPVTAEEAALAAEQIELDRLEEERVAAEKRAEGVRRLMELQLSKADAETLLDSHKGNIEAAVSERRQVLQQQAEQRAREAARDAAVETLRSMGFKNTLEQLHSLLSSKNNNLEQVIEALFELQGQQAAEAALKVEALVALGWSEAEVQAALEQNGWDQQAAEAALKVEALVALGWSKAEVQVALEQNGWDQQAAEIVLKTDKHWKQCDDDGFSRRLAKKLKKRHFACIASRGAPCTCKPVPCVANPVSPKQREAGLEGHSLQEKFSVWCGAGRQLNQEEFSGAFAKPRKPNDFNLPNKPMRFNEAKKLLYAYYGVDVEKKSEEEEEASEVELHDGGGEFVVARKKNMRSKKAPNQADASDSNACGWNSSEKSGPQDGDIEIPYIISCGYDDSSDNLVEEFSGAFAKPSRVWH